MPKITFDTDKIIEKVQENPAFFMTAVGALFAGAAKLMNANTSRKNSKTWKKEVDRRSKK